MALEFNSKKRKADQISSSEEESKEDYKNGSSKKRKLNSGHVEIIGT